MQLQKGPLGLLGWFSLKVGGRNPHQFGDAVQPTVEVGDNYLIQGELGGESVLGTNIPIGGNSGSTSFTVPAGKMWRLLAVGGDLGLAAADAGFGSDMFVSLSNFPLSGAAAVAIASMNTTLAGNTSRNWGYYLPRPLVLGPGTTVNIFQRTSAVLTVAAAHHGNILRHQIDV